MLEVVGSQRDRTVSKNPMSSNLKPSSFRAINHRYLSLLRRHSGTQRQSGRWSEKNPQESKMCVWMKTRFQHLIMNPYTFKDEGC